MTVARLLAFFLLVLALAGCDERRASAPAPQPRVVSLSPNTTEAMFAIGAGALLVGRSSHCDYPREAKALPSVGGYGDPNLEAILALEPTLVIGEQGPTGPLLASKLEGHGIATFFPETDSVAEISRLLIDLGERFERGADARRVAGAMQTRIERIVAWAAEQKKRSVVMVFDVSPLFVAGPGSFPDELIALAGAENLVDRGGKWPTIDVERLLSLDPDVIVDGRVMEAGARVAPLSRAPGFAQLRAVKEDRVRTLSSDAGLRPGPRLAEGLAALARAIHGREPP